MSGSMHLFVTELRDFYETPLGAVAPGYLQAGDRLDRWRARAR